MQTLTTSKKLRLATLCILYFAQGFPWGFMLTALLSFLASKGLTLAESGQLTAMAYLPWTFKLFWGPIIDSFTYRAMGRRRPWILFAQLGMALTLIAMILLAMLFIFGSTRDASLGRKIFFGIALGLSFELISRIGGALALSFEFSPLFSSFLPASIILVISMGILVNKSIH